MHFLDELHFFVGTINSTVGVPTWASPDATGGHTFALTDVTQPYESLDAMDGAMKGLNWSLLELDALMGSIL